MLPGQALQADMWEHGAPGDGDTRRIIFSCKVKETGKTVISNAYMELLAPSAKL